MGARCPRLRFGGSPGWHRRFGVACIRPGELGDEAKAPRLLELDVPGVLRGKFLDSLISGLDRKIRPAREEGGMIDPAVRTFGKRRTNGGLEMQKRAVHGRPERINTYI